MARREVWCAVRVCVYRDIYLLLRYKKDYVNFGRNSREPSHLRDSRLRSIGWSLRVSARCLTWFSPPRDKARPVSSIGRKFETHNGNAESNERARCARGSRHWNYRYLPICIVENDDSLSLGFSSILPGKIARQGEILSSCVGVRVPSFLADVSLHGIPSESSIARCDRPPRRIRGRIHDRKELVRAGHARLGTLASLND